MSPLPPTRERPVTGNVSSSQPAWDGSSEPPKRSRRWLKRLGIILIVLIAVAVGAAAALTFVTKQKIDDFVTPKTAAGRKAQTELAKPKAGNPTNILVLGSDNRAGDATEGSNSDTLMLVRLDPQEETISILSFPRDLYVPIPGHGTNKINSAYAEGGPQLTIQTIKALTNLDVNFVMNVDFKGFQDLVEQLGGIYVDVDHKYFVPEGAGYDAIDLEPGYQRLRGRDALDFARHRHSDSDFHRIARQQVVLTSLKKQLASSSLRKNIPTLISVLNKNSEVVAGGGDSVPYGVLKDFITLGLGLQGKDIYQIEYDGVTDTVGPENMSIVTYEPAKMEAAVAAFEAPSSAARDESANVLVGKDASSDAKETDKAPAKVVTPVVPSTVSVTVLNGSGVTGAAGNMGASLSSAGYLASVKTTPADNQNYANTRVQYRDAANEQAATELAAKISGATAEQSDGSNTFDTKLLVVVGKTGTQVGSSADGVTGDSAVTADEYAGNVVPDKSAPKVVSDAEYGKDPFVDLMTGTDKPKFPALFPSVRPTGTTYDEPVYHYKVAKGTKFYDAYRLVGEVTETSGPIYWGLQGTNWPNPPILDSPTREVTKAGRTYKLFFNGTHLHRVAWSQNGGTYWVENSLLDKLSNESLLAVAYGVKLYR
ncbi:MAG: LytR family transcriptional regulator [Thermoleophilia bacterium]|nr:LytR family transcriptional regulator [Thermoleophilia bacterium]